MDLVCNDRFKGVFLNCYFEKKWTRPIWEKVSVIKPSAFCWLPLLESLVRGCAHKLPAAESHNQCRSTPRHSLRTKPRIFPQRWRALRESMRWMSLCVRSPTTWTALCSKHLQGWARTRSSFHKNLKLYEYGITSFLCIALIYPNSLYLIVSLQASLKYTLTPIRAD